MPTPHLAVDAADTTVWKTLVHVQGTSGTLTGLGVAAGPYFHHVCVTLDGQLLAADLLAGTSASAYASSGIGVGLPFAGELHVEIKDDATASALTRFWAAYVTDSSELLSVEPEIRELDGRSFRYVLETWADDDGARFTILTSRGPARRSRVRLYQDVFVGRRAMLEGAERRGLEILLQGDVHLERLVDDRDWGAEAEELPIVVRPVARTTIVAHALVPGVAGVGGHVETPLTLPAPGDYEVLADVRDCANLPTSFRVL